jgi:hypothetical protein
MADISPSRRLVGLFAPACCTVALLAGGSIFWDNQPPQEFSLIQEGDSQSVLASLRRAQTELELVRVRHLPRVLGGSRDRPDAVFGRIRYWDESPGVTQERPPDHSTVVTARDALLAALDSAAALLPTNDWITGQRIRYLVDAGRLSDANEVAAECHAAAWWCDALSGFVAHLQADFEAADSLFAVSLDSMPEHQRCEWTDLRALLDPDLARMYRRVPCGDRDSLNLRIFWLADPMYSLPGNDRRTEHYARYVVHHLFDGTTTPQGDRWNDDNLALVRRYGWSETWEQTGFSQARGLPHVFGLHWRRGEHFLPSRAVLEHSREVGWDDWPLNPDRARERYAPRYATEFAELRGQISVFRRPHGSHIVAAFQVPLLSREREERHADTADRPREATVALVASPDEKSGMLSVVDTVSAPGARLALTVPALPILLSLEALNHRDRVAGRRRYWLDTPLAPPDSFGISDLLLVDCDSELPLSLESAFPLARTTTTFTRGDSIDVFWEVYGPLPEVQAVSVVVIKEGRSFLRRAAEWLGLAERAKPTIRLEWIDAPESIVEGRGRAVTLQLPEDEEGEFTVRLEVVSVRGERAVAERRIEVRGEDGGD